MVYILAKISRGESKSGRNTQKISSKNSTNGFFLTSVDDDPQKENVNSANNQQSAGNQDQPKPMFENIQKNTNYGSFNNNSSKMRKKRSHRIIYTNSRTDQKLPSVLRKGYKTSFGFHNTTKSEKTTTNSYKSN